MFAIGCFSLLPYAPLLVTNPGERDRGRGCAQVDGDWMRTLVLVDPRGGRETTGGQK